MHRDVHRRDQEHDRPYEPVPHLGDGFLHRVDDGRAALRRRARFCRAAMHGRAIAGVLDGRDDGLCARRAFVIGELHRVRQEVHVHVRCACDLFDGLRHARGARGAAHARDVKFCFLHTFVRLPWFWRLSSPTTIYFMTFCSVATSSSTTSSCPARMSSTTHVRMCCARSSLLNEFSADWIALTCVRMSTQ